VSQPSTLAEAVEINASRRVPAASAIAGTELERSLLVPEGNAQRRIAAGGAYGSTLHRGLAGLLRTQFSSADFPFPDSGFPARFAASIALL
jgi:hypothetical protein